MLLAFLLLLFFLLVPVFLFSVLLVFVSASIPFTAVTVAASSPLLLMAFRIGSRTGSGTAPEIARV